MQIYDNSIIITFPMLYGYNLTCMQDVFATKPLISPHKALNFC